MPVPARERCHPLGDHRARHLEAAGQAVHARSCLQGEGDAWGRLFCMVTLAGGRAFGGGGGISFPRSPVGAASITKGLWHVLAA